MTTNTINSDLDQTEINALEALIDKHGINSVLMALSDICREKGAIGVIVPKATGL